MADTPKKQLSLFDSTCLIVGIIVGAGIYETAPTVAGATSAWWGIFALWAIGGVLSLTGALNYAELATAYPREGGDYVYLSRAYGRWAGFLFGWIQLLIVRPGDIALMAFVFGRYGGTIWDPFAQTGHPTLTMLFYASASVVVFTTINVVGVREGKWTQNVITIVKAVGLLAIFAVALAAPGASADPRAADSLGEIPLSLAMILVLFTFGGWNEMAYVAAEVKNPNRNIVRALVLGTVTVTALYLLVNGAFLYALGHAGMAASDAVAADTVRRVFPEVGGRVVGALICISALGAVNGLIFTGARISYAVGSEHRAFRLLGRWHPRTGTPIWALIVQAIITLTLIVVLGSFERTILYTAAAVYSFYLATSLALIVLRYRDPRVARPYRVTGYPVTTLVFCGMCVFLIYSTLVYDWRAAMISTAILLAGLPVYWLTRSSARRG